MSEQFSQIVANPDLIMGVKAVWGRSQEAVMCFGARKASPSNSEAHYTQARRAAVLAQMRPYLITIGGGKYVPDDLRGRALELVRVTGVYGDTSTFVREPELLSRLSQWPVAVVLSEVYLLVGEPRVIEQLGFSDRRILENAYDGIIRNEDRVQRLWHALNDWPASRRWEVIPPPGFYDPGSVFRAGTRYPAHSLSSREGRRIWREAVRLERRSAAGREAKRQNKQRNGGLIVCEACGFSDSIESLFDAHHPQPLALGERETKPEDLTVLCPTCHRWAHMKALEPLSPLPLNLVQKQRQECLRSPLISAGVTPLAASAGPELP